MHRFLIGRRVRAAACLLIVGLSALALARSPVPRPVTPRGELAADEKATIDIFRRVSPSVVYITTLDKVINLLTMNVSEVPSGTGSGFVWDDQGHIVTNYHVIADAKGARIRFADHHSYPAELVGVSPEHDLAVLRIKTERKLTPLPIGTSHDLLVGQRVIAIGNPFGLDYTLTTGVVSALDRSIDGEGGAVHHLIQTDAAINPGNSGGPLLDSAGRLIGVNTSIYSPSGASAGIGFAIPVDTVNRVVPEIIAYGYFRRPTIGVEVNDRLSDEVTRQMGVKGVLILDVAEGSPAARAGLRGSRLARDGSIFPGDVILAIDGQTVGSAAAMDKIMDGKRIGDRVDLRLLRDGKPFTVSLTLGASKR